MTRQPAGNGAMPLAGIHLGVQVTVVFPDGGVGKNSEFLMPLLNMLVAGEPVPVGDRIAHVLSEDDHHVAWWQEGRHVVLTLGSGVFEPSHAVAPDRRGGLQGNPLFRKLADFKDYETDIRGFVDVRNVVELFRRPADGTDKLAELKDVLMRSLTLNQLGLTSIHDLVFHLGFDGQYQRSSVVLGVSPSGRRAGLARLLCGSAHFDPAVLPPLPPDAASVRVGYMDWSVFQDYIAIFYRLNNLLEFMPATPADPAAPKKSSFDLSSDVLAHLDTTLVLYNSLAEGPFFLGQGIAIKAKDEKKLNDGLLKLLQLVEEHLGGASQTKTYRGVDIVHYSPQLPGLPIAPAFTVHKGWLVIGVLPQTVKGHVLRSEGKHQRWQAPPLVAEALAKAKKKAGPATTLAAVTVTDPRPTVAVALSLMPAMVRLLEAAGLNFEVAKIPNAHAVTDWQFPGVTLLFDDGDALRWESHSAFEFPGDWVFVTLAYYASLGFF